MASNANGGGASSQSPLKKYALPIVAVAAVGAGLAWGLPSFLCMDDKCHTLKVHKVVAGPDGKVQGSFTVKKAVVDAIVTDRKSGACLLADYGIFNLPAIATPDGKCTTNADCGGTILSSPPPFVGWESACHVASGTCWVRPGKGALKTDVCNKGDIAPVNDPVPSNFIPFDLAKLKDPVTVKPGTQKVKMRAVACVNGVFATGATPPCGGGAGDKIMEMGPVTEFDIPQ